MEWRSFIIAVVVALLLTLLGFWLVYYGWPPLVGASHKTVTDTCPKDAVTVHWTNTAPTNIKVRNEGDCPIRVYCRTPLGEKSTGQIEVDRGKSDTIGCGDAFNKIEADCLQRRQGEGTKCKMEIEFL